MIRQITEFKPRYLFLHSILDRLKISSNDGALRKRIFWGRVDKMSVSHQGRNRAAFEIELVLEMAAKKERERGNNG